MLGFCPGSEQAFPELMGLIATSIATSLFGRSLHLPFWEGAAPLLAPTVQLHLSRDCGLKS